METGEPVLVGDVRCEERRMRGRPQEGWVKCEAWQKAFKRHMNGRYLLVYRPNSGSARQWFKWCDGHFRGTSTTLRDAKERLEREAQGGDLAWS